MSIWLAVSLILAVATIYMFMIEFFSVAFRLTGLAANKIKFQVASLFTSAGFTTAESELITNDTRRRKIAVACMYSGHIFSVIIMSLIINAFISVYTEFSDAPAETKHWYFIVFYVAIGLFLLAVFIKIPPINKRFQKFLENIVIKSSLRIRNTNVVTALDYYGRSAVVEIVMNKVPDFAQDLSLGDMQLTKKYAFIILSIRRGNRRVSVSKDTMLVKGDVILAYGLIADIKMAFIDSIAGKKNDTIVVDRTNEVQLINNYGDNALVEVYVEDVPKELENVKIKDAGLNDKYRITVGVIRRGEGYIYVSKDTVIQKGDTVTLFGPYKNIRMLFGNVDKK